MRKLCGTLARTFRLAYGGTFEGRIISGDLTYRVTVHEEPEGLWSEVPELPGCFATGETLGELREALSEAIALYLDNDPEIGSSMNAQMPPKDASRLVEVDGMRVRVPVSAASPRVRRI